jgi:cardiolipin synthase (CMP-forming)
MNVPNTLTTLRLLLIPLLIWVFFSPIEHNLLISLSIFITAGVTDILDGFIARKFKLITRWGQVMDPLADKLMQLSVLGCLVIKAYIPVWIIIVYGMKEVFMICGGIYLYFRKENIVIPANKYGKIATILFYIAVISMTFDSSNSFFIVAIGVSLLALVQYLVICLKKMEITSKIK